MKNTYWNGDGRLQLLQDQIAKLVPAEGSCESNQPKLEKFRQAANCYYDLYNNGLCNRAAQFRKVFGFSGKTIVNTKFNCVPDQEALERVLDVIIVDAFNEAVQQGRILMHVSTTEILNRK